MTGRRQRLLWPLFRIGLAALFIAVLINFVDLGQAFAIIGRLSPATIALVLMLFGLGQVLSSLRWRIALSQITKAPPSVLTLLRLYLVGMFVNLGIPAFTGGDIVRAEMLRRAIGERGGAYASIVADRLIGFLAVILVAMVAVLAAGDVVEPTTRLRVVQSAMILGAGLLVFAFALRRLGSKARWIRMQPFFDSIKALAKRPLILALCLSIAILVQTAAVILPIALLARAMGIDIPFTAHFVLVPIIVIVLLLPLAPNGLGLRETAFVFLYGQYGVPSEPAFALGLVWSLVLTMFGLAGGLVLALSGTTVRSTAERRPPASVKQGDQPCR